MRSGIVNVRWEGGITPAGRTVSIVVHPASVSGVLPAGLVGLSLDASQLSRGAFRAPDLPPYLKTRAGRSRYGRQPFAGPVEQGSRTPARPARPARRCTAAAWTAGAPPCSRAPATTRGPCAVFGGPPS